VRHTFSGVMYFSIYTLCSGFVSILLVNNFTLYDDREPEYSEPLVEKSVWGGGWRS
jgi:hypothetical protein